jgi:hypothetical protein
MGRIMNWRMMRVALFAAALAASLGSIAWGQPAPQYYDDDRYGHNEAREQGYKNGYSDGIRAGQYDLERGRRFKFKNDDWEDSRGYQGWMGNHGQYKQAYRDGYERGYRRGYDGDRRDRDDRYHDRDDWR